MLFNRKPQPPVILPPLPPRPHFEGIEAAIDYVKGYCDKHQNCSERCRLYDTEDGCCVFFDGGAGTPCDWGGLLKRKEDEDV